MNKVYICTLSTEIRKCEYNDGDGKCLNLKSKCGFKEEEKTIERETYIKPEKWYKKYNT